MLFLIDYENVGCTGMRGCEYLNEQDHGFQAVRDYWEKRAQHKRKVVLASCIEDGIVSGSESNGRTIELKKQRENLGLGNYYAAYAEKQRIHQVLEELFAGTEYETMVNEIQNLIEGKERAARVMYLNSLHLFGRKNGLAIYNKLKSCEQL